jgi:hypothetical protein
MSMHKCRVPLLIKVAPYSYSPVLKHLYSSDVILATRAWNLRGPVKIRALIYRAAQRQ